MTPGDISIFTSRTGHKRVAIVTGVHDDGTVDLAVLPTTHWGVKRVNGEGPDTFFDPSLPEETVQSNAGDVQDAPAAPVVEDVGVNPDAPPAGE